MATARQKIVKAQSDFLTRLSETDKTSASSLPNTDSALVKDEIRLRSYMEAALGGILAVNSNGCVVFMNGHTEQMFGCLRAEIIGKPEHADSRALFTGITPLLSALISKLPTSSSSAWIWT